MVGENFQIYIVQITGKCICHSSSDNTPQVAAFKIQELSTSAIKW